MKRVLPLCILALASCNEPAKKKKPDPGEMPMPVEFECAPLTSYFQASCPDHTQISSDLTACELIRAGQAEEPWVGTRALGVSVCSGAAEACDDIFVCLADPQGLYAYTTAAHVTGKASVEGDDFTFDAKNAWAYLGTKASGDPGDLGVLFSHDGRPWYFKLEDFAERASETPFVVDVDHPIKLENFEDNVEVPTGTVTVTSFKVDTSTAFDIKAKATDAETGESIDIRVRGKFSELAE
jgi:hypothetical protein